MFKNCPSVSWGSAYFFSILCFFSLFFRLDEFYFYFFYFFLFLFFFFCLFAISLGRSRGTWRLPVLGSNRSRSHWPTPEPQQRRIRAASATHTTAHGNAGLSTHWARAGTEPATSRFPVGSVNHCATTGTPDWMNSIDLYQVHWHFLLPPLICD